MYTQIHALITALARTGVLTDTSVSAAVIGFAQVLDDPDFGAALLGDLALELVREGQFETAEKSVRLIQGQEKSEHLRRVAEAEVNQGETQRAMILFQEARQAAFIYEYPTQQAQNIAQVARALEAVDQRAAKEAWEAAVQIATPSQAAGGTDGPEASGVLLEAVEAFVRRGDLETARKTAALIALPSLRERALGICK